MAAIAGTARPPRTTSAWGPGPHGAVGAGVARPGTAHAAARAAAAMAVAVRWLTGTLRGSGAGSRQGLRIGRARGSPVRRAVGWQDAAVAGPLPPRTGAVVGVVLAVTVVAAVLQFGGAADVPMYVVSTQARERT